MSFIITPASEVHASASPSARFNQVGARQFRDCVENVVQASPFHREHLSIKKNYSNFDCWLSEDRTAGFAVSPNLELVNVFSMLRGCGSQLMAFAVTRYPDLHLNCYAGEKLESLYRNFGFEEYRRTPNWTPGQPDVVFMRRGDVNTLG